MRLPKYFLAVAMTLALSGFAASGTASASDYDCYKPVHCHYKTVTVYVERDVAYKTRVVRYHSCGTPYYAWAIKYRTIKVPKRIVVKTCH